MAQYLQHKLVTKYSCKRGEHLLNPRRSSNSTVPATIVMTGVKAQCFVGMGLLRLQECHGRERPVA